MPASNWPTVTSWPSATTWPAGASWPNAYPFPTTVAPAAWHNGNSQAYSDLAGTLPVSSGLIRRLNEPAPMSGSWTTPADANRPYRDSNAVRYEPLGSAGGYTMTRANPGGVVLNACTIVVSFVARDYAPNGPVMGLYQSDDTVVGVRTGNTQIWVYYAGANWFTGLNVVQGAKNTLCIRYTPAGIDLMLQAGDTVTTASLATVLAATAVAGTRRVGLNGSDYMYGSVTQALEVARAVTDAERLALMSWAHSQTADLAYPNTRALIAYVGDSITRMTGANYGLGYPFLTLANVRPTFPLTENCDCGIGGTGVTNILNAGSTYRNAAQFYSAARSRNIMVWLLGTNDIANNNSVAYTLYGTGAPGGAGLYAAMAQAKAAGWRNVLCTIGPRSDVMAVSQVDYDTRRAAMNTDIAANWATYADAFVDTRGITNFGADGDSNNTTYYSTDKVHPVNAGHALLAPAVTAAVQSLL